MSPNNNIFKRVNHIKYRPTENQTAPWKESSSNSARFTINGLRPFTNFTFIAWSTSPRRLARFPNNSAVTTYFKTEAGRPHSMDTKYFRYSDYRCLRKPQKRCITLYWQSLAAELRNDILLGYCVQYINGNSSANNTKLCLNSNKTVDSFYKEFQHLPWNQTLTFSIVAVTKNKRMSPPAYIQVKHSAPAPPSAVYVSRVNDSWYNVSWRLQQPEAGLNVSVVWCRNDNNEGHHEAYCEETQMLNKSFLLVNSKFGLLPDVDVFVVSSENGTSALRRSKCVFIPGKRTRPPQPVVFWSESQFVVKWPDMSCSQWNGVPLAYVLSYAEGDTCDTGKKQEFPVSGRLKGFETTGDLEPGTETIGNLEPGTETIGNLEPGTKYSVCLQLKTLEGGLSMMSKVLTDKTKGNVKIGIYVMIGLLVVIAVIGVISVIVHGVNKYRKIIDGFEIDTEMDAYTETASNYYEDIKDDEKVDMDGKIDVAPKSVNFMKNCSLFQNICPPENESVETVIINSPLKFPLINNKSENITNNSLNNDRTEQTMEDFNETNFNDGITPDGINMFKVSQSDPTYVDECSNENISGETSFAKALSSVVSLSDLETISNMEESCSRETGLVEHFNEFDNISSESTEIKPVAVPNFVDINSFGYVIDMNGFKPETVSSQNGVPASNTSNETGYVTASQEGLNRLGFETISSSENGYIDDPVNGKLEAGLVPSRHLNGNSSSETDYVYGLEEYVDNCLNKSKLNSDVIHENMDNNEPNSDYVFSEPVTKDGTSQHHNQVTQVSKSEPSKEHIEEKVKTKKETCKFPDNVDKTNDKETMREMDLPDRNTIRSLKPFPNKTGNKNVGGLKLKIFPNPSDNDNLINSNVPDISDSLQDESTKNVDFNKTIPQTQHKQSNTLAKANTSKEEGISDYVKTEDMFGYIEDPYDTKC
ncbi:uncharacterized protein LOC115222071 [Argonauta hians]